MPDLNETHDPDLTSWVESADASEFPIQNLPFAVFRRKASDESFRGGVGIGDQLVDLAAVVANGVLSGPALDAATAATASELNELMGMGREYWSALRLALSRSLRKDSGEQSRLRDCLLPQADAEFGLPCTIGDFTDFFASIHHATKASGVYRPDNPLPPNYKWIPICYHGRSSSIELSGAAVHRPSGQVRKGKDEPPQLALTSRLDHELELGFYVGPENRRGTSVAIDDAVNHVFGVSLLNDWSARDIQAWEARPLGPFLGKNFATTVSPWIVSMEALAPYRVAYSRAADDPAPLAYLNSDLNTKNGAIDIHLEVMLQTATMQKEGIPPERIGTSNFVDCYWTLSQLVAHHTVNGCNLRPGDLLGSGTQSGPEREESGCMLELTSGGRKPLNLSSGETRQFLEDGDTVVLRGWCERDGAARIGLGELRNTVGSQS
ncbi:MAG: fumarylacetoacetase [Pseudomonadota bacterium]